MIGYVLAALVSTALADGSQDLAAAADKWRASKAVLMRSVDKSISGDRIAAMPYRFVGKNVDLHCIVVDTASPSFFDATCQKFHLAIEVPLDWDYQRTLKVGQAIRVFGIVEKPWGGIDQEQFPAVQALFIDKWGSQ